MMVHIVTPRGLVDLRNQIREAGGALADFDNENPLPDKHTRDGVLEESLRSQQRLALEQRIARLNAAVQTCRIAEPPTKADRLQVGHIATIRRSAAAGGPCIERRYEIGGYLENDPHANPPIISYDAPLVASLMGCEVGTSDDVTVAGQPVVLELVAIELPPSNRLSLAIAS